MLSVGAYFFLHGALYVWTNYIERDIVYIGKKEDLTVFPHAPTRPSSYLSCLFFREFLTDGGLFG